MNTCAQCSAALPAGAKFCHECGTAVAPCTCPTCGTLVERGRFCSECGSPLDLVVTTEAAAPPAPVAERRVTSVLFADLVGFTPLSESRDAEDVRELLSRYFAECRLVIGRYGGTVEKFIGDAVMAVWGVPVAREDDAQRAVRAGLELLEAVTALGEQVGAPGLAMRVGIVTGEVAVTLGATGEGMVAGDAVNTAARVQSAAQPGEVWVDESTRSLTAVAVAYRDAGSHGLKGKAEPVQLWHAVEVVAEVGGGQRMDGLEARLTGRDRELRLLKELFHSTEETHRPRLVVVDGDPGVGKSRLAWEFEKYVDGLSATIRWHRGRCLSYGDGVAFWALAEAVRGRLGLTEADTGDVVGERLEEALARFVRDQDEREWLRPRLGALVGSGVDGHFERSDLFTAWSTLFERLSEDASAVVLVVDDAQYADDGLLDFLDHLLVTSRAPILVLALARPELLLRRPDLGGRRSTVIRLDPLDDEAMATLVDGLVVGLSDEARSVLVQRAEGVPLFAVETVRALIDRDAVVPRDGRYVPADGVELDLADIGAPASLQALVAARLDALTPLERRVVSDASVLGASFTREGLEALGTPSPDLDVALAGLQRKEILSIQRDRSSAERGQFRFVQSVVKQVAHGTLSRHDRRARHLAAADFLAVQHDSGGDLAVVVAQHLLDAVDASGERDHDVPELVGRACALLERAGVRTQALGSPTEACRLFESALSRATEPADRARLHQLAAEAAFTAAMYAEGASHAADATALFDTLGRPVDAGVSAGVQCRCLATLAEFGKVIAIAEPRWEALEGVRGAELALVRLASPLSTAYYEERGDLDRASQLLDKRLRLAEALGDPREMANALNNMGTRYQVVGGPRTACAFYEAGARIAREHDLPEPLGHALMNLGTVLMSRDVTKAKESLLEARSIARRAGIRHMVEYAVGNYASLLWATGQLAEAKALIDEYSDDLRTPTTRLGMAVVLAWIADAQGEPVPAVPDVESTGSEWDLAGLAQLQVAERMSARDAQGAAALAQTALHHTQHAMGMDDDFMHFWPPLVRAALAAGDADLAERLLEPVSGTREGLMSPAVAAHLLSLRGLVGAARGDDEATVEADLRAAVVAFTEFGAPTWAARAHEDLGRWLVARGRGAEGADAVQQALALYEQIGAVGWLRRLEDWLGTMPSAQLTG